MIVSDGYSIEYYKNRNQIVIQLPQTMKTISNTVAMVVNRKVDFTAEDLAIILNMVKAICRRE